MGKIKIELSKRNQRILESYNDKIKDSSPDDVIDKISSDNHIGKFYVRSILKEQGVEIGRKTSYNRKDKALLLDRDAKIIEEYKTNYDPDKIASQYNISSTRVRQIVRTNIGNDASLNSTSNKTIADLKEKADCIKKSIAQGVQYKDIVSTYGKPLIKLLNYKIKYNVYKDAMKHRTLDIIKMFKNNSTPLEISKKYGMTRYRIYTILNENGLRTRISPEEKTKRDKSILKLSKTQSSEDIAKKYDITPTMVRIIVSQMKSKDK